MSQCSAQKKSPGLHALTVVGTVTTGSSIETSVEGGVDIGSGVVLAAAVGAAGDGAGRSKARGEHTSKGKENSLHLWNLG